MRGRELRVAQQRLGDPGQGQAARAVGQEEREQRAQLLLERRAVQHLGRLLPARRVVVAPAPGPGPHPGPGPIPVHGLLGAAQHEPLDLLLHQRHTLRGAARLKAQDW